MATGASATGARGGRRASGARGAERDAFDGCASLASTVRARVDAFDARATSVTG